MVAELALAFGIYTFQYAAMANFLPTLLVDRLGLSISAAGTISAITVAANAVGNIFAGALLRMGAPIWAIAAFGYCFVGAAGFGIFSEQLPVIVIAALASASLAVTGLIPASIFAAAPRFAASAACRVGSAGFARGPRRRQARNARSLVAGSSEPIAAISPSRPAAPIERIALSKREPPT